MKKSLFTLISIILIAAFSLFGFGCGDSGADTPENAGYVQSAPGDDYSEAAQDDSTVKRAEQEGNLIAVPAFDGVKKQAHVIVNNNVPSFTEAEKTTVPFEYYSRLDSLGRCGTAFALICAEIMPEDDRESIASVHPSGWNQEKYDFISNKYLYNRCHLIGYQLAGENDNEKNLITGTRFLNISGMLEYENLVAAHVHGKPSHHVLYRATPVFIGNNLVCSGVQLEMQCMECDMCTHNVFCYNVQPGVVIYYNDGSSAAGEADYQPISYDKSRVHCDYVPAENPAENNENSNNNKAQTTASSQDSNGSGGGNTVWITDSGTKYHADSSCIRMKNPVGVTKEKAESMGYNPCSKCCK